MPTYQFSVSYKIKEYRRKHKLSQSAFGKLIGVSAQAVSKWEQGRSCPDILLLPYLSSLFGCTVDDFFEQKDVKKA